MNQMMMQSYGWNQQRPEHSWNEINQSKSLIVVLFQFSHLTAQSVVFTTPWNLLEDEDQLNSRRLAVFPGLDIIKTGNLLLNLVGCPENFDVMQWQEGHCFMKYSASASYWETGYGSLTSKWRLWRCTFPSHLHGVYKHDLCEAEAHNNPLEIY